MEKYNCPVKKELEKPGRTRWQKLRQSFLVAGLGAMVAMGNISCAHNPTPRPPQQEQNRNFSTMQGLVEGLMQHQQNAQNDPINNMSLNDEDRIVMLAERLRMSTVTITTEDGLGSGVVIGSNASLSVVLTAKHVVTNDDGNCSSNIQIRNQGRTARPFGILIAPHDIDLALLIVNDNIGPSISISRDRPRIGPRVFVVGAGMGANDTVTSGIISNYRTEITESGYALELLQTDAAINPGNSGGGLYNMRGELIGIPVSVRMLNPFSPAQNMGYAIPARLLYQLPLREWSVLPIATPQPAASQTPTPQPSGTQTPNH